MASTSCVTPSSGVRRRRAAHSSFEPPSFSLGIDTGIDTETTRPASGNDCTEAIFEDVETYSCEMSANQRSAEDGGVCNGEKSVEQGFVDDEEKIISGATGLDDLKNPRPFKRLKRGPSYNTARTNIHEASPVDGMCRRWNATGSRAPSSANGELRKHNIHVDPDESCASVRDCSAARPDHVMSTPRLEKRSKLSLPRKKASPSTPVLQTCSSRRHSQGMEDSLTEGSKLDSDVSKREVRFFQRSSAEENSRSQSLQPINVSSDNEVDDIEDISDDGGAKDGTARNAGSSRSPNLAPISVNVSSSQKPSLHISKANIQSKLQCSPMKATGQKASEFSSENNGFNLDEFDIRSNEWCVARQKSKNRVQDSRSRGQKPGANPSMMSSIPGTSSQSVEDISKGTVEPNIHELPSRVRQCNTAEDKTCEIDPFSKEDSLCDSGGWRSIRHVYTAPNEDRRSSRDYMSEASPIIISSSPEELGKPTLHIPGATGEVQKQASSFPSSYRNTKEGNSLPEDDVSLDEFEQEFGWRNTRHDLGGRGQVHQQGSTSGFHGGGIGSSSGLSSAHQRQSNPSSDNWWNDQLARSSQTSQRSSPFEFLGKRSDAPSTQSKSQQSGSLREGNIKSFFTKTPVRTDTVGPSQAVRPDSAPQHAEQRIEEYLRRRLPNYKSVDDLLVNGGLDNEPVYIDYRNQFDDGQGDHRQAYSEAAGNFKQWPAVRSIRGAFSSSTRGTSSARKRNATSKKTASRGPKKKQNSTEGQSSASGRARPAAKQAGGGRWTTANGTRVFVVGGNRMSGKSAYVTYRKGRGGFPSKKKGTKRPSSKAK